MVFTAVLCVGTEQSGAAEQSRAMCNGESEWKSREVTAYLGQGCQSWIQKVTKKICHKFDPTNQLMMSVSRQVDYLNL